MGPQKFWRLIFFRVRKPMFFRSRSVGLPDLLRLPPGASRRRSWPPLGGLLASLGRSWLLARPPGAPPAAPRSVPEALLAASWQPLGVLGALLAALFDALAGGAAPPRPPALSNAFGNGREPSETFRAFDYFREQTRTIKTDEKAKHMA